MDGWVTDEKKRGLSREPVKMLAMSMLSYAQDTSDRKFSWQLINRAKYILDRHLVDPAS